MAPKIVLCLACASAGCQDESGFSLTPGGLAFEKSGLFKTSLFDPCRDVSNEDVLVRHMLDAVNAERAKRQLVPLKNNATLAQIADFYACRLADGVFFSHQDPFDGSTVDGRAADFGYAFLKIGENLAAGQLSAEETVADWMASPGHRTNILDPAFTEIGISVKVGGEYGSYWVVEFGRPITAPPESEHARLIGSKPMHEAASQPSQSTSRPSAGV